MVMYAGRIMEYGPAKQIFEQPQHPYAWGLLDSMPSVEKRLVGARADRRLAAVAPRPARRLPVPSSLPVPLRAVPDATGRRSSRPAPDTHPDACHLSWEDKQREGGKRSIARLGDAA